MKYLKLFEDFNLSDKDREELLYSPDGFNSKEDANNHINYLIRQFEYESKQDKIRLYRVIFVNSKEDINTDDFGRHWSTESYDEEGVDLIRQTTDPDGEPYIVIADFKPSDIDYKNTLRTQVLYPWEYEYYTKEGSKPINYKIIKFEDYNDLSYQERVDFEKIITY